MADGWVSYRLQPRPPLHAIMIQCGTLRGATLNSKPGLPGLEKVYLSRQEDGHVLITVH